MCEFVTKNWLEGTLIQRKYRVIEFLFETRDVWLFRVWGIEEKVHGKIMEIDMPEKDFAFPKRKILSDGSIEMLDPPRFYNRMRNRAIDEGKLRVQGDEAPPLEDKDLFDVGGIIKRILR